jgi:hypothetical protein
MDRTVWAGLGWLGLYGATALVGGVYDAIVSLLRSRAPSARGPRSAPRPELPAGVWRLYWAATAF